MNIDRTTAQRIVEQLGQWLAGDIWVVNQANQIMASNQSTCRAPMSLGARWTNSDDLQGVAHRCNLPLNCANQEVGRLIIDNIDKTTGYGQEAAQAAQMLAELIVYQHALFDQNFDRQWTLNKFVYDLLHSNLQHNDAATQEYATFLGIDLTVPRLAVVIDLRPPTAPNLPLPPQHSQPADKGEQTRRYESRHLIDRARSFLGVVRSHIYNFFDEHQFVILLALDAEAADGAAQRVKPLIQSLMNALACSPNDRFTAGIGAYHAGWHALPQSYQDARFALETGQTLFCPGRTYTTSDLGLAGFACANSSAIKSDLADHRLLPLFAEPELLHTLTTFLNAGLSVGVAAEQLHLHRHSLTYRLKKIHELTGLDPAVFRDAAQLDAALQWQRMAKGKRL